MNLAQARAVYDETGEWPYAGALARELNRGPWKEHSHQRQICTRALFRSGSTQGKVFDVVRSANRLMAADEVRAQVPDAAPKQVSVALSDLTSRKLLVAVGPMNERRYRMPNEDDLKDEGGQ